LEHLFGDMFANFELQISQIDVDLKFGDDQTLHLAAVGLAYKTAKDNNNNNNNTDDDGEDGFDDDNDDESGGVALDVSLNDSGRAPTTSRGYVTKDVRLDCLHVSIDEQVLFEYNTHVNDRIRARFPRASATKNDDNTNNSESILDPPAAPRRRFRLSLRVDIAADLVVCLSPQRSSSLGKCLASYQIDDNNNDVKATMTRSTPPPLATSSSITTSLESSVLFAINPYSQWRPDAHSLPSLSETLLRIQLARAVVVAHTTPDECRCRGARLLPADSTLPHHSSCVELLVNGISAAHTSRDAALELNVVSLTAASRLNQLLHWPAPALYCRVVIPSTKQQQSSQQQSQSSSARALLAAAPLDVWASHDAWKCVASSITPLFVRPQS
jgi:hypothetical protein